MCVFNCVVNLLSWIGKNLKMYQMLLNWNLSQEWPWIHTGISNQRQTSSHQLFVSVVCQSLVRREYFLPALQVVHFSLGVFWHWRAHLLSKCIPCSWTNNSTDTGETACGRKARKETGPGCWGACTCFSALREALQMLTAYLGRKKKKKVSGTQFCHLTYSWAASLYVLSLNNTTEHNSVWAWGWGSSFSSEQHGF